MRQLMLALFIASSLSLDSVVAQEPITPWRDDPIFQRLAAVLDKVPAIDMHTHLLKVGTFDSSLSSVSPILVRSSHPWLPGAIQRRFGVTARPGDWPGTVNAIAAERAAMMKRLGEQGYWHNHLDYTTTEIALVNQYSREGIDNKRLRWVPHATVLLYPLPAEHLMERSPSHKADISEAQVNLRAVLKETALNGPPDNLEDLCAIC